MATHKLKTGTNGEDGKAELLEFRWDGCQSIVCGYHPTTAAYHYLPGQSFAESEIVIAPLWMIEQMKTQPSNWTAFERSIQLPITQNIPLHVCLSKTSRELLTGVSQGYRDNAGAKLARDLLGTVRYLESIGQSYEGNPRQQLDSFGDRCTPPLTAKDCDRLWKSALKDNPGPSLAPEQIETCIKAWLWRQLRGEDVPLASPSQPTSRAAPAVTPESLTLAALQHQIREFIASAPTETQLTAQVMDWATRLGKSERSLWSLVKSIQQELEHQESRIETRTEIDHLSRLATYQPSLSHYLHPHLAQPLEQIAHWMGSTGMAMLTTLLPTAGSLLTVGSELELNPGTEHLVYPILYTGIVAESGSGKSPAQKTILKPLFRLQAEAEMVYQTALEDWEQISRQSKEAGQPPPEKPKPRDYFTTDATREAVVKIQANQPDCGFLGWFDELSALIRGQNQYRSGRGTDKESLLSGRDGSAQKVDRAGGKRLFIARSAYSITGSTQPDTLRSLMGDFSDPSGQWARFLWCFLPIRPAPYPEQAIHLDMSELLYSVYQRLSHFPPTTYRLSPAALTPYIHWYNHLDQLRLMEVKQSLRAVYAKFKSDTGVLALLLHCLNAAIAGQPPLEQVSAATMRAAIQLSKFYIGQVKLIQSEGDALNGDLTPSYCKILSLSQRRGWITAREIYRARAVSDRSASLDQIRGLMRELVTMGLAEARNQGNRLEIQAISRGDSNPHAGDDSTQSGDNAPEFGDNSSASGDNWIAGENERELAPVEYSPNGTVTGKYEGVTTNGAVVTSQPPGWQQTKTLPVASFTQNGELSVTTELYQPAKARPPNSHQSAIRVGDICRYWGPDGAMKVTCWGKDLQVLAIENGIATVKANQWVHSHQVENRHLRKVR